MAVNAKAPHPEKSPPVDSRKNGGTKIGAYGRQRHESCKVLTKCGAGCARVNCLPEVQVYKDGVKSFYIGPLGLLVLTLATFFDVLFLPGDAVLSGVKH